MRLHLAVKYMHSSRCPASPVRALAHLPSVDPLKQSKSFRTGYFEIATADGIRPMFLEVDLGTEALKIWQQKAT